MGTGQPKRPVDQVYEELEDIVRDAVIESATDDPVLRVLIEVTVASIWDGLPIFGNPLHEPILYRLFRRWVAAGLEEAAKLEEAMEAMSQPPQV